jgi:hypothetical protein
MRTLFAEGLLLLAGFHGETGTQGGDRGGTASTMRRGQVAVHRALADADPGLARGCRSAAMLPFKGLSRPSLGFHIRVDLRPASRTNHSPRGR